MVSSMKLVGLRIFAKLRILFNGGEHNCFFGWMHRQPQNFKGWLEMITQNMVGGWYVDEIVSELVPFKFDDFSTQWWWTI